jgi:hypothetical protein
MRQVDGDAAVELRGRYLAPVHPCVIGGVVDQHETGAVKFFEALYRAPVLLGIGDVAAFENDGVACIPKLAGERGGGVFHEVDEADTRTLRGEALHDRFADSRGASGNHDRLVFQARVDSVCHCGHSSVQEEWMEPVEMETSFTGIAVEDR